MTRCSLASLALTLAAAAVAALVALDGAAVRSAASVSASRHSPLMKRVRLRDPVLPDLFIYSEIEDTNLTACRTQCANDFQCDIYMFINEDVKCFLHTVV